MEIRDYNNPDHDRDYVDPTTSFEFDTKLGKITAKVNELNYIYVEFSNLTVNSVEGILGSLRLTRYENEFEPTYEVHDGKRTQYNHRALYAHRPFHVEVSILPV